MNGEFTCRLCHTSIPLSKFNLKEVLEEFNLDLIEGPEKTHLVKATFVTCLRCGKTYPVVVDDETTLPILEESVRVETQLQKYKAQGRPIPEKLRSKHRRLHNKLDFKRQQLALKYGQSFYQLEDGTLIQLDYCYQAQ